MVEGSHGVLRGEGSQVSTLDNSNSACPGNHLSDGSVGTLDWTGGCLNPRLMNFYCSACGKPHQVAMKCGSRFEAVCSSCSDKWVKKNKRRFIAGIMAMKTPKLITVTLNKRKGVVRNKDRIWGAKNDFFHRLRHKGYRLDSWFGAVENLNHIHMIVDCDYIPQFVLSDCWKAATGDSYVVDIRKLNVKRSSPRDMVNYMVGYLTKGSEIEGLYLDEMKSFHLVGSWGLPKDFGSVSKWMCDCGVIGHLVRLSPDDAEVYVPWWESNTGPPPVS